MRNIYPEIFAHHSLLITQVGKFQKSFHSLAIPIATNANDRKMLDVTDSLSDGIESCEKQHFMKRKRK